MRNSRPIRRFFRFYISLAALSSLAVAALVVAVRVGTGTQEEIHRRNLSAATLLADRVAGYLNEPAAVLGSLGGILQARGEGAMGGEEALLCGALTGGGLFDSIALLDPRGRILAVGLPPARGTLSTEYVGLDLGHLAFVNAARPGGPPVWSDAFLSILGGERSLALCLRLGDGRALLGNFRIEKVEEFLKELRLVESSAMLLDRNGDILMHGGAGFGERFISMGSVEPVRGAKAGSGGVSHFRIGGEEFLGAAVSIRENGWVAVVVSPASLAMEPVYDALMGFALAFAVAVGIALFLSRGVAEFLSQPLRDLAGRVREGSDGPAAFADARYGISEVDGLSGDFGRMLEAVGQREAQLRDSERKYRQLVESVPVIPWEMDIKSGRFLYVGPQAGALLGHPTEEWTDLAFWESLIHPDDREATVSHCLEQTRQGRNHEMEYRLVKPDGGEVWVHEVVATAHGPDGEPRLMGLMIDISKIKRMEGENRELENRLRQSQKLEAIGTLAGGVAHDFNNILGVILGYTELTLASLEEDSPFRENLEQVTTSVFRARDIIRQILAFSRVGEQNAVPLELSPIVKEGMKLLRATLPTTVQFRLNLPERSGHVCIDPTAVHQVLINLCSNAALAMREKGGTLTVALERVSVAEGGLPKERPGEVAVPPGEYVCLTVSDTGVGIEPKLLERIFEPYFTTRPVGEGSGLGLAVVHGIVRTAGGHIRVKSAVGVGTTFKVFLPVTPYLPETVMVDVEETELRGGRERLLVVDDEPSLLDLMRKLLGRLGYRVTVAPTGARALELYKADPGAFDLILSDQNMPGLSGVDFCLAVRETGTAVPFLLLTGYSDQLDEERAAAIGASGLLRKPTNRHQLARAVRETLDAAKADAGEAREPGA